MISLNLLYIASIFGIWLLCYLFLYLLTLMTKKALRLFFVLKSIFFLSFCFACLGFSIGLLTGGSRIPVVGAILPALMTFLAGFFTYILVIKEETKETHIRALVIITSLSIFILYGAEVGAIERQDFEKQETNEEHLRELKLILFKDSLMIRQMFIRDSLNLRE